MLAIFLIAMLGKGSVRGLVVGTVISFVIVLFVRTDVWLLVDKFAPSFVESLGSLPTYDYDVESKKLSSVYSFVWAWPLTAILTFVCGLVLQERVSQPRRGGR